MFVVQVFDYYEVFNPWHMLCRVTVVVLCVSVLPYIYACKPLYVIYTSQWNFHGVLYGVFKKICFSVAFVEN